MTAAPTTAWAERLEQFIAAGDCPAASPATEYALDRMEARALAALLRRAAAVEEAARGLQRRLDSHFGGHAESYDWKEQAALREALEP